MKFSLNPITAQKMAGLQKIVRRLIIIFLSSFFLVIIRALLLSSYGKNLAKPYYEPKDAQFARNFHPEIECHICKIPSNASKSWFSGSLCLMIIRAAFWSSYYKIRAEPHCCPKYGQFAKHSQRPFIQLFLLIYLCVSCKQHFGVLLIIWPVWKVLPEASEPSVFATPIVLTIITTLWSSYREIVS